MADSDGSFIRMVWDFYGPEGQPTAAHFLRHLEAFLSQNSVTSSALEVEVVSTHHAAVYVDLGHAHLDLVGQALKPHRVYEVSEDE